jgi:hypothetical protein
MILYSGAALDRVVTATRRHGKLSMTLVGNNLDRVYCRPACR